MTADPEIIGNCKCGQVLRPCDHPGQCCDCFDVAVERDVAAVEDQLPPSVTMGARIVDVDGNPMSPEQVLKIMREAFVSGTVTLKMFDGGDMVVSTDG